MIQLHHRCLRHEQLNQLWRVAIGAKIHIVKASDSRTRIENILRQLPSLRMNLMQCSEVNPIYGAREQSFKLDRVELREIVGCRAVKNELRLPIASQRHRSRSSRVVFVRTKIIRSQAKTRHIIDDLLPESVGANSADE